MQQVTAVHLTQCAAYDPKGDFEILIPNKLNLSEMLIIKCNRDSLAKCNSNLLSNMHAGGWTSPLPSGIDSAIGVWTNILYEMGKGGANVSPTMPHASLRVMSLFSTLRCPHLFQCGMKSMLDYEQQHPGTFSEQQIEELNVQYAADELGSTQIA